ncbi:hypothetical protein BGZ83_011739 [Gryganskiella cystojenkinii]|nr:hypothetical protein BGZ83_011739 [Gryganskiella cystojenkinii]
MTLLFYTALSLVAAVAYAQPQADPPRTSRAITMIGNNVYLYGGSDTAGNCYSDLYSLNLDSNNGWVAGEAPWQKINIGGTAPLLGQNSWAVPSSDGSSLLFYGQTLCPQNLDKSPTAAHTYTSTSGSLTVHTDGKSWAISNQSNDVLGPRSVAIKDDTPVPVQVYDTQQKTAYVFVYDLFNPQLGTQLYSFSSGQLPTNIALSHNTTLQTTPTTAVPSPTTTVPVVATTTVATVPTASAPPPVVPPPAGTSAAGGTPAPAPSTAPPPAVPPPPAGAPPAVPPPPAGAPPAAANNVQTLVRRAPGEQTVAPFVDVGCAVYVAGTIVVIGGGKSGGAPLAGDDVDTGSGYYKMDRYWVYNIAANSWEKKTVASPTVPLPRRLHALLSVGNNQIYMHGGNTTQTDPTVAYSNELWILNTETGQWTAGPPSKSGRASHTLLYTNNEILALSGFEFMTTTAKAASNAFPMMYNPSSSAWSTEFGTITPSYFSKYGAAIIGGSVGGFLVLVIIAAVCLRIFRRRRGGRRNAGLASGYAGFGSSSRKPFTTSSNVSSENLATSAATVAGAGAAAGALSGMKHDGGNRYDHGQIDLSALPRNSESTMYDLPLNSPYGGGQKQFGNNNNFGSPYQQQQAQFAYNSAQVQQQQQVPLMSANALEHGHNENSFATPYRDDDETEFKDHPGLNISRDGQFSPPPAMSTSPRQFSMNQDRSQTQSFHYNNSGNNNGMNDRPIVHSPPRNMSTESYSNNNNGRDRSNSNTSMHSNNGGNNYVPNNGININNQNRQGGNGGGDLLSGFP